jgi:cation:H+ antiporter
VLGASSVLSPEAVPVSQAALDFDIPIMIAVAVATLPIFISGSVISRLEGVVFLAFYVAYTAYLVLDASNHSGLHAFENAMMYGVIPITGLTLATVLFKEIRQRMAERSKA